MQFFIKKFPLLVYFICLFYMYENSLFSKTLAKKTYVSANALERNNCNVYHRDILTDTKFRYIDIHSFQCIAT